MSRRTVEKLFRKAGIRIDGKRPWDIQVRNERFFDRLLAEGSLGAGESYVEGWWECEKIDEMVCRLLKAHLDQKFASWPDLLEILRARLFNPQKKQSSFSNAQRHYDLGHDLYEKMLDRRMMYSCAFWEGAKTLEKAQENKLALICKKLGLKSGMKVLDIGCGWGGFARYATEKHDVRVTGITVSKDQCRAARENCGGLPVKIVMQDYRDLQGRYDRVVSIGMFEHVGYKNYRLYMETVRRCLKDDGCFLLHTIGGNRTECCINPWIQKYIFPNAMLPSIKQIGEAIEGLFVMEDWHNLGPHYDRTLMSWYRNFKIHWKELAPQYGESFYRLWKFYLLSCAGSFRARNVQVWQLLLSKNGISSRDWRQGRDRPEN
ncbi:MAG: cyclopropane fatty acyl phospholipid synthase [bacterium]